MRKRGFTVLELLVYTAIFSVVIVGFITIFVTIVRIQGNQSSSAEVDTQSTFLLQQIQYYVEQSSLIDMPQDAPTSTLTLRMANPGQDPTTLYVSNGVLYMQQTTSSAPQALSSNLITISNISFTKRSNVPAHDSVDVSLTVAYNTTNIQQAFSQVLQTSIARVSAATFDSDLLPSSTAANHNVGLSGDAWYSIDQLMYFVGSNVGIGVSSPGQSLEVNGGIRLNTATSLPTCSSSTNTEGTLWVVENGGSSSDTLQLCVRGFSGYQWVRLY
jgi:type II secretory pathway pseudopilin PulG